MTPLLSVVVPVKNVEPWIAEMLDGVLRQAVDPMEVIVVDDGSDDETTRIVEEYVDTDERVRLLHCAEAGGGHARNTGLDAASGRYVVFADGDDLVPDDAYRTLVAELERTGSDIAIGRHLKFSSGSTWEPMARWYDVEQHTTVSLEQEPLLIANRSCWNRVFRMDFVRQIGLRFPDAPRANDIVPMVRSLVRASRIDLVPAISYLYRERPGRTSMSARSSSVEGILSYFRQELLVAQMLTASSADVRAAHARVVLDADGWVHLDRFLRSGAAAPATHAPVVAAVRRLMQALPDVERGSVRPERRVLWALVRIGASEAARRFAVAAHASAAEAFLSEDLLDAWLSALRMLAVPGAALDADRFDLVRDGLLTLLAIRADRTEAAVLASRSEALAEAIAGLPPGGSEVLDAVAEAVRARAVGRVQFASAARRLAPLVVDTVRSGADGLAMSGPIATTSSAPGTLSLAFTGPGARERAVPVGVDSGRWWAVLPAEGEPAGRRRVVLRAAATGTAIDLPVVTARMPLPPVTPPAVFQPLADRRDGWRFLVDRLPERASVVARAMSKVLRRRRG